MSSAVYEPIEGEILPAVVPHAPVTLFRTEEPGEVVKRATATATELKKVIRRQKLAVQIQGREHVLVEGWTLLGTMLGVFPICTWTRQVDGGWEARVEARTMAGAIVGAAEAQCMRSETNWKGRDDYALRSMAQTRATAKALRLPLGFVMTLAGYEATPAEEMPHDSGDGVKATVPQVKKIRALIGKLAEAGAIDKDAYAEALSADYGVSSAEELTKSEASQVIEALVEKEKELG